MICNFWHGGPRELVVFLTVLYVMNAADLDDMYSTYVHITIKCRILFSYSWREVFRVKNMFWRIIFTSNLLFFSILRKG